MERLTERDFRLGFDDSNKLPSYEAVYERLREYENAEQDGRLLELSCKVGDYVWDNDSGRPCAYEVTGFSFGNLNEDYCDEDVTVFDQLLIYYSNSSGSLTGCFAISEIGKTVFLSKEAAEAWNK